jgi:hypothetical protein
MAVCAWRGIALNADLHVEWQPAAESSDVELRIEAN